MDKPGHTSDVESGHDMPQQGPRVSVIMATYNCAHTLQEALDSLAAQTYRNWDLVVCDDASTDDSHAMLVRFADGNPNKVTILRNEVNSKLAFSLNRCLEHASGDYIARMDGDDISRPERLAAQVAALDNAPDVAVVGTAMQRFDATGIKDVIRLDPAPTRQSMRRGVPFAHATIMMRPETYAALGGYTVSRRTERTEDYDLWFRFFAHGFKGYNLQEPLYLVREDGAAIRRRTLSVRWQGYQTTLFGFRLLGYPRRWYIRPTLELLKILIPPGVVGAYRRWQHRRSRGN